MKRHDPSLTTRLDITRLRPELLLAAAALPTATLHEAGGKIGALPSAIKPVALYMVWQTARAVGIPVVGAGGITSGRDAVEFLMAGAHAVEVGTASLYEPNAVARIAREIGETLAQIGESSVASVIGTLQS